MDDPDLEIGSRMMGTYTTARRRKAEKRLATERKALYDLIIAVVRDPIMSSATKQALCTLIKVAYAGHEVMIVSELPKAHGNEEYQPRLL